MLANSGCRLMVYVNGSKLVFRLARFLLPVACYDVCFTVFTNIINKKVLSESKSVDSDSRRKGLGCIWHLEKVYMYMNITV